MNLQQLRYVVATVDHGTMTAAARACHVAQPALSRAIRTLEQELGLTLFARRGRGVELTPDGHALLATARSVVDGAASIERLGRRHYSSRALTMAMTRSHQGDLGAGVIDRLWRERPGTVIRVITVDDNAEACAAVAEGRADVAVAELPTFGAVDALALEDREVVALVPDDADLPDPVTMGELGTLPLVLPAEGGPRRSQLEIGFAAAGVPSVEVGFESDDRATWPHAVAAGAGCCLWYRSSAERAAVPGVRMLGLDPPRHATIALVHRPQPGPLVADVLELLA